MEQKWVKVRRDRREGDNKHLGTQMETKWGGKCSWQQQPGRLCVFGEYLISLI
jgi:hypothetical protein